MLILHGVRDNYLNKFLQNMHGHIVWKRLFPQVEDMLKAFNAPKIQPPFRFVNGLNTCVLLVMFTALRDLHTAL